MGMIVNCVAARVVCGLCYGDDTLPVQYCRGCGARNRNVCYLGPDSMDKFCTWLLEPEDGDDEKRPWTYCFAHNFRSFDAFPLLNWLYRQNTLPEVIMTGCKVMYMQLRDQKVKFLDSLNFLPMALKNIPKAMGLAPGVKKGEFPHRVNKMENLGKTFSGHPPLSAYDPDSLSPKDRVQLEQWLDTVRTTPFDFDKELRSYCQMDVEVLLRGVLAFREKFLTLTRDPTKAKNGIEPFFRSATIAGACNVAFRQLFLEPETIGLIPSEGYNPKHNQSRAALEWLSHLNATQPGLIRHSGNGGEIELPGIGKVDGFREDPTTGEKVVYEFHVSSFS